MRDKKVICPIFRSNDTRGIKKTEKREQSTKFTSVRTELPLRSSLLKSCIFYNFPWRCKRKYLTHGPNLPCARLRNVMFKWDQEKEMEL